MSAVPLFVEKYDLNTGEKLRSDSLAIHKTSIFFNQDTQSYYLAGHWDEKPKVSLEGLNENQINVLVDDFLNKEP